MKSKFSTLVLSCAAIATLCVGAATANAGTVTGGNDAIDRGNLDLRSNFSLVDTNHPISSSGVITGWNIYAGATTQVELLIVDPTTHVVKGESSLVTPVLGYNSFTLSTPISVAAGDLVGYYTAGAGVVKFDYVGSPVDSTVGNSGNPTLGSVLNYDTTYDPNKSRTYSINVVGTTVPEPSTLALLVLGVPGLAIRVYRRRVTAA